MPPWRTHPPPWAPQAPKTESQHHPQRKWGARQPPGGPSPEPGSTWECRAAGDPSGKSAVLGPPRVPMGATATRRPKSVGFLWPGHGFNGT